MKIKDKFSLENVWEVIKGVEDFPFLTDIEMMNKVFLRLYGNRCLMEDFILDSVSDIGKEVTFVFSGRWNNLNELLNSEVPIVAGSHKVIIENVDNSENRTNENENLDKVSAYNSDDLMVDSGNSNNGKNDLIGKLDRKVTESVNNLNEGFNNLSLLSKNNIMKSVIKDVSDYISYNVRGIK